MKISSELAQDLVALIKYAANSISYAGPTRSVTNTRMEWVISLTEVLNPQYLDKAIRMRALSDSSK